MVTDSYLYNTVVSLQRKKPSSAYGVGVEKAKRLYDLASEYLHLTAEWGKILRVRHSFLLSDFLTSNKRTTNLC